MLDKRVALLTNFIPPHHLPMLSELNEHISVFQIFLSTLMEPNRTWPIEWKKLNVIVQRSVTFPMKWKHPKGFSDTIYVHFPYDTISQLSSFSPDVVISTELGARSLLATLYCRFFKRRSRLIYWLNLSEHTEHGRGSTRSLLRKWLLPKADALIVNGKSGANYIRKSGYKTKEIFLVPYTVPIDMFLELPIERKASEINRILIVGQLIERKGLVPFLKVVNQWAEKHSVRQLELTFVGDGPLRGILSTYEVAENLDLKFLGNVDYEQLPDIYANADILAFPTLADEWGVVVNEALAAGLPVLGSTYSQAVEELIKDGENGWTFRPDRDDDMLIAIGRALSVTPQSISQMRLAARSRALDVSPKKGVANFLDAINFVLE